jgi:hypothetical protein
MKTLRTIVGIALKAIGGIMVLGCAYDLYGDYALWVGVPALLGGAVFFLVGEMITGKKML